MNEQAARTTQIIRNQYENHEITKTEQLKKLNRKAHLPGILFGYTFGTFFTLLFGAGMCMGLRVILEDKPWAFYLGIVLGIIGIVAISVNHLIVRKINKTCRKKYQKQILDLSQEILDEHQGSAE